MPSHIPRLDAAFELLCVDSEDLVLDVGCGKGDLEATLPSINLVSIDITESDVREAFSKNRHATFLVASGTALPFRKGVFDKILAAEVIEHVPRHLDGKTIFEFHWCLRKGGKLVLTTPAYHIYYNILDPGWFFFHHRHFRHQEIRNLIPSDLFIVEHISQRAGFRFGSAMLVSSLLIGGSYRIMHARAPLFVVRIIRFLESRTRPDFESAHSRGYTWFIRLQTV